MRLRNAEDRRRPLRYEGDGTYVEASPIHTDERNNTKDLTPEASSTLREEPIAAVRSVPNFLQPEESAHVPIRSQSKEQSSDANLTHRTINDPKLEVTLPEVIQFDLISQQTPNSTSDPAEPRHEEESSTILTQHSTNMANIKYVAKHNGRSVSSMNDNLKRKHSGSGNMGRPPKATQPQPIAQPRAPVSTRQQHHKSFPKSPPIISDRPAAFPSLPFKKASREQLSRSRTPAVSKHGIVKLMTDRFDGATTKWKESTARLKKLYATPPTGVSSEVWRDMGNNDKSEILDAMNDMASSEDEEDVPPGIPFESLYPSLQKTIVQEIMEGAEGHFESLHYPVKCLLNLTQEELNSIEDSYNAPWDKVPKHLQRLKMLHPDKPVDPDTPPAGATEQAARYLEQEKLPLSLLGEWNVGEQRNGT